MNHYPQSLVLEADPATVYATLAAPKGLGGLQQFAETGRGTPYELEAAAAAAQ